jgi:ribonuclease BN (tRNA processing enzyme)
MKLVCLGTNGWYPTSTGSTTCTALVLKGRIIVLDAGDGFYKVADLAKKAGVKKIDVFLSHLHLDHIIGLHSTPKLPRGCQVRLFVPKRYLAALKIFFAHPYTITPEEMGRSIRLFPLEKQENRVPYSVKMLPLVHADPCFGYRFELEGKSIAYCTDTGPCKNIALLAKGADLLVTECALSPGSQEQKEWPHLSPEMAAAAAKRAGASRLLLTHFDANKYASSGKRKEAEKAARKIFANTTAARDGLEMEI